jgi:hypothetical protein
MAGKSPSTPKPASMPKSASAPKLTDAERHKRYIAMAKEVGASDDPKDFETFKKIALPKKGVPHQKE